jgi:hypothetical protein
LDCSLASDFGYQIGWYPHVGSAKIDVATQVGVYVNLHAEIDVLALANGGQYADLLASGTTAASLGAGTGVDP